MSLRLVLFFITQVQVAESLSCAITAVSFFCFFSLSLGEFFPCRLSPLCLRSLDAPLMAAGVFCSFSLSPSAVLQARKKVVEEEFEAIVKQKHADIEAEHNARERGEL